MSGEEEEEGMTREEGMKMLLDHGMSKKEAVKFLTSNKIKTKGLQLPAQEALALMNKIAEYGIFAGPVRFFVMVTEENEQRLLDLLNSTGHEVAFEGGFDTHDMSKDPIGDYSRRIQSGYAGTADFEGIDPSKLN